MRFRANIYFTGEPWAEFNWIGRTLAVGGAVLRDAPAHALAPARRKALLLQFARLAAWRATG